MIDVYYNYIIVVALIVILLYAFFNIGVIIGWLRLPLTKIEKQNTKYLKFSILIPIRNEENHILDILRDIENQIYDKHSYEIIVIDDSSQDKSYQLVKQLYIKNLTLIKSRGEGKKEALKTGLDIAKNSFIIQTDADCKIGSNWLAGINQYLNKNSVKLLIAPVVFRSQNTFFSSLQELDFYGLMMNTAGLAGLNHPIMANGANLIYPKELVSDYNHRQVKSSSGDDIFLLHYIKKKFGNKDIHFLKSKEATIETAPNSSLKEFVYQRLRWASKSKYYNDLDTIGAGIIIFTTYFSLLILLYFSFWSEDLKHVFLYLFIFKLIIDTLTLLPILKFYKKWNLIIYFPILAFVYPFYVSFVGIISLFVSFKWKGRLYS